MSEFPDHRSFIPPAEFAELRMATLDQIEKDFALQGIAIELPRSDMGYGELISRMAAILDEKKIPESSALQALLYQLDISESFASREVLAAREEEITLRLADAIVKRCFAKVVYRRKLS
jgi:hypothetical protein